MPAAPRSPRRLVLLALALVVSTVVALVLSPSGSSPNAPVRATPAAIDTDVAERAARAEARTVHVLQAAVVSQREATVRSWWSGCSSATE